MKSSSAIDDRATNIVSTWSEKQRKDQKTQFMPEILEIKKSIKCYFLQNNL